MKNSCFSFDFTHLLLLFFFFKSAACHSARVLAYEKEISDIHTITTTTTTTVTHKSSPSTKTSHFPFLHYNIESQFMVLFLISHWYDTFKFWCRTFFISQLKKKHKHFSFIFWKAHFVCVRPRQSLNEFGFPSEPFSYWEMEFFYLICDGVCFFCHSTFSSKQTIPFHRLNIRMFGLSIWAFEICSMSLFWMNRYL